MEPVLQNQVAVVCGASGRVGSTIARRLAASGAAVAIQYRSHAEKADRLAQEIIQAGGKAHTFQADVTDEASVVNLFQQVTRWLGGVHILVNAVHGQFDPKNVAEMSWEDWAVHLDALKGHFLLCKAVLPYLREKHYGRIVFISGGLSRRYFKGCSAYTTVKAGLNGFCKTLALEEGTNGITVNIVAPGKVVLGGNEPSTDHPEAWENLNRQSMSNAPLGRDATAEDVASAVLYFVSPQAVCITGQTLFVTGGEIMP
jgi:3-oxoacyl-[acyl-carrier protein] reductase